MNNTNSLNYINSKISLIIAKNGLLIDRDINDIKNNCCKYIGKDYCNDLNAMNDVYLWMKQIGNNEAEQLYWESMRTSYGEELVKIANNIIKNTGGSMDYILSNLSAMDKATAFIKIINQYIG